MTDTDPIIKLRSVNKSYQVGEFEVNALVDVSLNIYPGEYIVILGPSGSGKTTLLNMIGGLDTPTSGTVEVNGHFLHDLKEQDLTKFRRHNTGFIFQFFNLLPTLSAYENIDLVKSLNKESTLTAQEMLEAVGLGTRKDHFPNQLSGGEQQRVAIARALVKHTPIMLCDEPTGELDFETGIHILKVLRELNQKHGITFLIVTHNAAIASTADRVIRLRSGQVTHDDINQSKVSPDDISW